MTKRFRTGMPFLFIGLGFMLLLGLGTAAFGSEFGIILRWWSVLLTVGACAFPLTFSVFHRFQDGGWIFSKTMGLLLSGYGSWLAVSVGLARFTWLNTFLSLALCLLLGCGVWLCRRSGHVPRFTLKTARAAAWTELAFFALLLFWLYVRAFKPGANGTEKFMDYGMIAAILRSDTMPPQDFWLSGFSVNYYYFGQFLTAWLTRLSGLEVQYTYNLMMMTLAALGCMLPYSIGRELALCGLSERARKLRSELTGVFAGLLTGFAGNGQYLVYRLFGPLFGNQPDDWWFSNPTRYIGYFPETSDKTIHEFPAYSFILGDLHAHVLNLVFTLTLLGIMLCWARRVRERAENPALLREALCPEILLLGFFLGCFWMTNGWDLAIYFVTAGAIVFFNNLVLYRGKGRFWLATAVQGGVALGIAFLISLPFNLSFEQIAAGVGLVQQRTPLNQLLTLWGIPLTLLVVFLFALIRDHANGFSRNTVFAWLLNMKPTDQFALVLGLCAGGLVLLPELVYVKDIYTGDYIRANTMFKLTYQAFTLFAIFMPYAIARMFQRAPQKATCAALPGDASENEFDDQTQGKKKFLRFSLRIVPAGVCGILLLCTCLYGAAAIRQWYGNILRPSQLETLDASVFWDNTSPSVRACVDWLNENVGGTAVIAEANGASYSHYNGISAFTGLSSVLGWRTHEWLWRSGGETAYPAMLTEREEDLSALYTSGNQDVIREICFKYGISYICVTSHEREKYSQLAEDALREAGTVAFESGGSFLVQVAVG